MRSHEENQKDVEKFRKIPGHIFPHWCDKDGQFLVRGVELYSSSVVTMRVCVIALRRLLFLVPWTVPFFDPRPCPPHNKKNIAATARPIGRAFLVAANWSQRCQKRSRTFQHRTNKCFFV
ncbi:unnamed protein product [Ectocarpus sp. 12 AP-2014]